MPYEKAYLGQKNINFWDILMFCDTGIPSSSDDHIY